MCVRAVRKKRGKEAKNNDSIFSDLLQLTLKFTSRKSAKK